MRTLSNADLHLLLAAAEYFSQSPCETTDTRGINQRRRVRLVIKKLRK